MSGQVAEAKLDIGAAIEGKSAESVAEIEGILERILDQQSKSQNRAELISYITLALVIVVFGIEAFRYFQ